MSNRTVSRVVVRRNASIDEWQVRAYDQNGKRWYNADYFTSDGEDAFNTAHAMSPVIQAYVKGKRVTVERVDATALLSRLRAKEVEAKDSLRWQRVERLMASTAF